MPRQLPALYILLALPALLAEPAAALCGDVDGNGVVEILDALAAAQASATVRTLTPLEACAADTDASGQVTILDALRIAQTSAAMTPPMNCSGGPTSPLPVPGNPYSPARLSWMASLAGIASASIARADTSYPVFHGCIDWHSAVHSHWMLIRHARVTGNTTHDAQVQASLLQPGGIDAEAAYLRSNPGFEMPYGRAWFLRLVIEYEIHFQDPQSLRAAGDEVLASLEIHYQAILPGPLDLEYANASWAFTQMIDYARHTGDAAAAQRILTLVETRFDRASAASLTFDADHQPTSGFFSRFGNWIHLVATARCPSVAVDHAASRNVPAMNLTPLTAMASAHHLGMNPSRAWALAALARVTGDPAYQAAWEAHLVQAEATHAQYAGDYFAYDHWVPSFVMYALTEPLQ